MVTATLDVERRQVEPARPGRTEQKIADVVDHQHVVFLGDLRSEPFERQVDRLRRVA